MLPGGTGETLFGAISVRTAALHSCAQSDRIQLAQPDQAMMGSNIPFRCVGRLVVAGLVAILLGLGGGAGAQPAVSDAVPQNEPFLLEAQQIVYDFARRVVIARGKVEVTYGEQVLLADEIRYEEADDRVVATGNIVLIDAGGEAAFAERLELTGDFKKGFIEHIRARLDDNTRIAANLGLRAEGRYNIFEKAVYSPCPIQCNVRDGGPFWQIRARRVVHDQKERTLTYYDAVLEILGVPVAYTPYFQNPDPTVDRRSGFLAPRIGADTELGLTLETPYYFDLAPNRDLTLTPLFSTRQGLMLKVEGRDLETFGRTELEASATYAEGYRRDARDDRDRELRGHIRGRGDYTIGATDRAGFEIGLSSDNTYLDAYGLGDEDVLTNRLYYERYEGRRYATLGAYGFQGLRETDDQGTIPFALPLAEYHQASGPLVLGSYWTLDAGALALTRTEGLDTQRLTAELGWELPYLGAIGDLWRLRLSLRGDVYRTDGDPRTFRGSGGGNVTGRLLPSAYLGWSWPLVGRTGSWQQLVEPVAALMIDRSDGNDRDIPNEDSQSFEFDETNLFAPSRFTGIDRVEQGTRVAYGVRAAAIGPGAFRVSGMLGQLVDLSGDNAPPPNSGLEGHFSDFVGRLDLRPGPYLDVSYRFRFAADDLAFRRNDAIVSFGPPRLRFRISYLELSDEPLPNVERKRKELVAAIRLGLTDELSVGAQTRRDLTENETIASSGALIYRNPCFVLTAGIERQFTSKGELSDETTFTLRIGLAGLGDIGTSTSLEEVQ